MITSYATWSPTTAYPADSNVVPLVANGYGYTTAGGGTSAAVAPNWPTTSGATVVDNTVTWTCLGPLVDWDQVQSGAVVGPLASSSPNSLLRDADPAIFFLLDFITYVICHYAGERLLQAFNGADVGGITSAVMDARPYEPQPHFFEDQFKFPALFVYRTRGETEQWTVGHGHDICGIEVVYVLPPGDSAYTERVVPILRAVYGFIRRKVDDAWDPGYTPPGGEQGQQFDSPELANLEEIGFGPPSDKRVVSVPLGFEYGHFEGTGKNWFPSLMMRGFITERDETNPTIGGPVPFAGSDITGNLQADDGTVVSATPSGSGTTLVQASTQLPPSIASLSVDAGPVGGGTLLQITGARFLPGPLPQVYFGPRSQPFWCPSVMWVSATQLNVTTPTVTSPGPYALTVVNGDDQQVVLEDAFTFE
jgi:hypothetical protein